MSRHSDRSKAFHIYISNDMIINSLQEVKGILVTGWSVLCYYVMLDIWFLLAALSPQAFLSE